MLLAVDDVSSDSAVVEDVTVKEAVVDDIVVGEEGTEVFVD